MHSLDDLGAIDALQVDRGDTEVAVPQLALDNDQRHPLTSHLHCVRVTQLVGSKAPANSRFDRGPSQLGARSTGGPRAAPRASVDDAEQRTMGNLTRASSHGSSSCQPQSSMPTSRRRPSLPRRTSSEPRRWSRSGSRSDSASSMRSPARHNTTTSPRNRRPCSPSPAARITATISSTVGGSAG
jgi:hypothetical protein